MRKTCLLKKILTYLLITTLLFTLIFTTNVTNVYAAGTITQDNVNKTVTATCSNMTMVLNYNNKMIVSSLKLGGTVEVVDTTEYFHSAVCKGGIWTNTLSLAASPTVSINGNVATFTGISYTANGLTVNETWTVTANDNDINLNVNKTYVQAATLDNQCSLLLTFKEKAFDVVQRTEDGGSFILLDNARNDNRFLSNVATANYSTGSYYNNDKYSFFTANMDFIDKLDSKILSVNLSSNRNRATKITRPTDRSSTRALKVEHKLNAGAFSFPRGTTLPLEMFQKDDFSAVTVSAGQTDTATYSFSCANNMDKYYNLGNIPSSSGLDQYKLAQYMQDFGRSSVVDKNVGMGDCDVSGIGTYETWWYSVNALGLQGAGNTQYLETLKNFVRFVKSNNYPIHNNGQLYARTYRGMTSWERDDFTDAEPQFVAGAAQIFNLSNDTSWLNEVKDTIRSVLSFALSRDTDGDGLMEGFNNYNTDNKSQDWNDCVSVAYESAYSNAMLYKALVDWADIEEFVLLDAGRATTDRNAANKLKTTFNKDISAGGFWSPFSSSFVYWRDKDNSIHGDNGYVFVNTYPIIFGMVDNQRAQQIMNKYSDFMILNNLTLFPTQRSGFASGEMWNPFNWKIFENGAIFLQHTYDMMGAYAKIGNKEKPLSMLKAATNRYITDNLWCLDDLNWDLTPETTFAEPWMSAGARPAAGYYNFILGIQPKYNKLVIDPCIDSSLNGVSGNYNLRGHAFTIEVDNQNVRNITIDGAIPVESVWSNLPLSVKYMITDENLTNSTTTYTYADSGTIGRVSCTFSTNGQHRLTLSEDTNCSNIVLNTTGSGYPAPSASYTYSQDNVWWAIDGIAAADTSKQRSRWTCYGSPNASDWYAVDFGANNDVGQVSMNFYSDGGGVKAPASYSVQYWNGSTWVDCSSQIKYPATPAGGENYVKFTPVNTQKVRIMLTHQSGSKSGMNEFRVFSPYTINYAANNTGSGYPIPSASYTFNQDSVWSAVDGDWTDGNFPRTRWTCYNSGHTSDSFSVDFGSSNSVSEVRVNFFEDGLAVLAPASYTIQYWNGTTWVDCPSQVKYPAISTKGENKITFTSVNTSKIQIVMNHQSGKYSGITEFRAYK